MLNRLDWLVYESETGCVRVLFVFVCSAEDVQSIVTGKLALKYAGVQIQAIQSIAKASENRSVAEFEKVRQLQVLE